MRNARPLVPLFVTCCIACAKEESTPRTAEPASESCDGRTELTLGQIDGPACELPYEVLGASDQRQSFNLCTEYTFESTLADDAAPCSHDALLGYCVDVDPRDARVKLVYVYAEPDSSLNACDELELRAAACLNRAANTWCNAGEHQIDVTVVGAGDAGGETSPPNDPDASRPATDADDTVPDAVDAGKPSPTDDAPVTLPGVDSGTDAAVMTPLQPDAALSPGDDVDAEPMTSQGDSGALPDETEVSPEQCIPYEEHQSSFRSVVLEGIAEFAECSLDGECELYMPDAYVCEDTEFPVGFLAFPFAIRRQLEADFQLYHDELAAMYCPETALYWPQCSPEGLAVIGYVATCEEGKCASSYQGLGF